MESNLIKGGAGSGSWSGPGQPRFARSVRQSLEGLPPKKLKQMLEKLKAERYARLKRKPGEKPTKVEEKPKPVEKPREEAESESKRPRAKTVSRLQKIDPEVAAYFAEFEKRKAGLFKDKPSKDKPAGDKPSSSARTIQNGKEWVKSLSEGEKESLEKYRIDWDEMRDNDKKGKKDARVNDLYSAVLKAPKVETSIYRGLTMRNDIDFKNLKIGGDFKVNAMSSFSTDVKVAELFAGMNAKSNGKPFVLLECKKPKKAYSIKDLPSDTGTEKIDKEALVPKGTKYRIIKIEKMSLRYSSLKLGSGPQYEGIKLHVEEI